MERFSFEKKESGWKNETDMRGKTVQDFLADYFNGQTTIKSMSEGMEFSGGGVMLMEKVQKGEVHPREVSVLYENSKIIQVHAVFISQRNELNLDVYLTRDILEKFLVYDKQENRDNTKE